MQIFSCPFCGPRDEPEFHYAGEAGNDRPAADADAGRWSAYLYINHNRRGRDAEIWKHLACGEYFVMERDTVTHEVLDTRPLPHWNLP